MYEFVGAEDWSNISLYDVAKWTNGLAFKDIDFTESGYPVIKIAELKNGITAQTKFTKSEYSEDIFIKSGDIVFAWSGSPQTSIDTFRWEGMDGWLNQHIFKVTPKEAICPQFLFFLLKSLRPRFVQIATNKQTTGLGHVTVADLKEMRVGIPSFSEQQSIVQILAPLYEKIENNRQMNETLEKMVRTIFKSWFLDFDPVHAKASGKAPTYMDTKTASLFPNTFSDDGLPTGWSKLDVGSTVDVHKGLSYKGKFLSDSGSCMINLGCFGFRGTFKAEKIKHYSGDYKDRHKIKPGDLIFANTDMTQERAILCSPVIVPSYINKNEMIFTHHVSHVQVLRPQHPVFTEYLRQCMMTQNFRIRAEGYATGTTVLSVPKNIFDGYYVPIPSNQILDVFFEFISGISKKLEANYIENKTLSELRDTLLPKLMSGEIRLKDAEYALENNV